MQAWFINKILKASYYIITGSSNMTQCHPPWSADFLEFQPKFESYFQKTGSISQVALLLLCTEKGLETAAGQPFLNRQAFVCLQKPSKYYFF